MAATCHPFAGAAPRLGQRAAFSGRPALLIVGCGVVGGHQACCAWSAPKPSHFPLVRLTHTTPQAHDEQNACAVGDTVRIDACRPLSKRKAWSVGQILSRERSLVGGGVAASAAAAAAPTPLGRGFAASAGRWVRG